MRVIRFVSSGFVVALCAALSCSLPAHANNTTMIPYIISQKDAQIPRYSYIQDASIAIIPSSQEIVYTVMVSGSSYVTSIAGTVVIYKKNSSGEYEQVYSQYLKANSRRLFASDSTSSRGSGDYKITFSGTVYADDGSEPIEMEMENSY